MPTYTLTQMTAQASRGSKAVLRDAAIAAGLTRYAVPLCGGGFTDHHRITSSGRCAECSAAYRKRRNASRAATFLQEPLPPAVIEAKKAAKSAARKARRDAMTPEERTVRNRADRARRAANRRKGPRTLVS